MEPDELWRIGFVPDKREPGEHRESPAPMPQPGRRQGSDDDQEEIEQRPAFDPTCGHIVAAGGRE